MLEVPTAQGQVGIDECGRGCLAGPVVAAAVMWDSDPFFDNPLFEQIKDSKKLSAKRRKELSTFITQHAKDHAIAFIPPDVIDAKNILQATFDAMHQCVRSLTQDVTALFIDGNKFRPFGNIPHTCVVKGDGIRLDIAAASIISKVARDEYMERIASTSTDRYDWTHNKGYGTKKHIQAIREYGYDPVMHRMSFHLKK
jgi:ribonuclease HII